LNRGDFQRLSDERLSEAQLLLTAGKWSGAYYLAGYAVECALKACILALIEREGTVFKDKKFSEKCWTHKFADLLFLAGLKDEFEAWVKTDSTIRTYRNAVEEWNEASRYEFVTQEQAEKFIRAIEHPNYGVLPWIRKRW